MRENGTKRGNNATREPLYFQQMPLFVTYLTNKFVISIQKYIEIYIIDIKKAVLVYK